MFALTDQMPPSRSVPAGQTHAVEQPKPSQSTTATVRVTNAVTSVKYARPNIVRLIPGVTRLPVGY